MPDLYSKPATKPNINSKLAESYLDKFTHPQSFEPEKPGRKTRQPEYIPPPQPARKSSFRGPGCSCRGCGCLFIMFIVLALAILVATVIQQPPFLWEPLKQVINNNVAVTPIAPLAANQNQVIQKAQKQLEDSGRLKLTQDELANLVAGRTNRTSDVIITPNSIKIFINIDNTGKPLWAIVELGKNSSGQLKISSIGTGLFVLPSFVTDIATDLLQNLLLGNGSGVVAAVLNNLQQVKLREVTFKEGEVEIVPEVDLDQVFPFL